MSRRELSLERRKVTVLSASVAAMSGGVLLLQHAHPWLTTVWLGLMAAILVYVISQLVKIKRQGR